MERKHKVFGFSVPTILAAILLVALLTFGNPTGVVRVWAAGTPDAHGNQIENMTVRQFDGTWKKKGCITSANYSANFEIQVIARGSGNTGVIYFHIWVRLNSSLASGVSDAKDKMMVNVTISGGGATGWTNKTLVENNPILIGNFYYMEMDAGPSDENWWDEASHPAAGQTYTLKIYYHAYY